MGAGARADNAVTLVLHHIVFYLLQNWRRNLRHSQDKLGSLLMRIYIPDSIIVHMYMNIFSIYSSIG